MQLSYRWLTEVLGTEVPLEKLLNTLTMAGLEVESVHDLGVGSGRVVVGRILTREPHPNADNLSLCDVQAGEGEPLRIVCGAKNMQPGDLIPLALEGAVLPGGFAIKKSKIRGEASFGMMCSGRELGFGEDHEGLLILPPDQATYREGQPFDALIEIKVTPNRPDCLSVYGIARDVGALLGLEGVSRPGTDRGPETPIPLGDGGATLSVEAPDACPRYVGRIIRGVKIGPSPLWLRRKVEAAGLRSINNVVDVTNLILIEQGQPLHAFDLKKVAEGHVVVRYAFEGEKVKTLDDQELTLNARDLLIADSEKAIALAGIMGCGNSEINEQTTDVFLECAYFDPATIRRTSKRLGKSTDSSYRFERGIDWSAMEVVIDRAAWLIEQTAGGQVEGRVQFVQGPQPAEPVKLHTSHVNSLLGVSLRDEEIANALRILGFGVHPVRDNEFNIQIPAHRPDVSCAADLVEEIARVVGYDKIPAKLPALTSRPASRNSDDELAYRLRRVLTGQGFLEIANYSFEAAEAVAKSGLPAIDMVRLSNPLSAEYAVMRTSLLPSMLATAAYNHNRGELDLRLFEIGKTYLPAADNAVKEEWGFVALMTGSAADGGWRSNGRTVDFYDARAIGENFLASLHISETSCVKAEAGTAGEAAALHPGKSAVIEADGKPLLLVGHLHPQVRENMELKRDAVLIIGSFSALAPMLSRSPKVAEVPVFPAVTRDLALVADQSVAAADIEAAIAKRAKALLSGLKLFDVYEGEKVGAGKRSLAYKLKFSAPDRTLTDEEVNQMIEKILGDLNAKLGVTLRA